MCRRVARSHLLYACTSLLVGRSGVPRDRIRNLVRATDGVDGLRGACDSTGGVAATVDDDSYTYNEFGDVTRYAAANGGANLLGDGTPT
jgi:hypothetical protein